MNAHTHQIISACTKLNRPQEIVAYSVDAGFHVFLFCLNENVDKVKACVEELRDSAGDSILEKMIETRIGRDGTKVIP